MNDAKPVDRDMAYTCQFDPIPAPANLDLMLRGIASIPKMNEEQSLLRIQEPASRRFSHIGHSGSLLLRIERRCVIPIGILELPRCRHLRHGSKCHAVISDVIPHVVSRRG